MIESLNQTAAANQSQCDELAAAVLAYCETNRFKIAAAESLTGGLLADAFVRVPGASKVFLGSAVTYDIRAKASILGVDAELLLREGAVHPEVARQMAFGTARLYRQQEDGDRVVGLSTTGVAGPGPDGDKPPLARAETSLRDLPTSAVPYRAGLDLFALGERRLSNFACREIGKAYGVASCIVFCKN